MLDIKARWWWRALRTVLLGVACPLAPALAHDTWFAALPSVRPGDVNLLLGTGNQYPAQEYSVGVAELIHQGCRRGDGPVAPLKLLRDTRTAVLLQSRVVAGDTTALSCWAQLQPFELELPPDKIEIYLKEVNPPDTVREQWKALAARGLPWKERYTKHARIELGAAGDALPSPMAMDIVLDAGLQPVRVRDTIGFRVLRDGAPLAQFAVELRSALSPLGLWVKTDDAGHASIRVPLAGRWLLRGIDLRIAEANPDTWDSRFVTLAFDVGAMPSR